MTICYCSQRTSKTEIDALDSFQNWAATTAAAKGIEDCIIKTLGKLESLAYLQYIKIPHSQPIA